jgi:thymidylate kinase
MLIIIEGPDKSGKTTLAKKIEEQFHYKYAHFSSPGNNPGQEYAKFFSGISSPTVCDRSYFGERVYGPLLRGVSKISDLQYAVIERICRLKGAIFIYVLTPLEVCQARLLNNLHNEKITLENNVKAWTQFKILTPSCSLRPFLVYDASEQSNMNSLLRYLEQLLPSLRSHAILAKAHCTGIGTIYGRKLVFVGETLNKKITWLGLPFDNGPASNYLYERFKEAEVPENMVYLCNAISLTKKEVNFLNLAKTTWISLGVYADRRLSELGIKHRHIPHPQYWKRFHAHEPEAYVKFLKYAMKGENPC